jgi:hypothetical protein
MNNGMLSMAKALLVFTYSEREIGGKKDSSQTRREACGIATLTEECTIKPVQDISTISGHEKNSDKLIKST